MRKCIKSWKKYCPDYKIVEWNEKNFDIQGSCDYVREAYREQKWAFVSDYVRLWIIYNFGGIYLDTDVELIKNLDNFRKSSIFSLSRFKIYCYRIRLWSRKRKQNY